MSGWAGMLRLAAARFGVAPEAFWRLSVAEWRALTAGEEAATMTRGALEVLARDWPDGDADGGRI